MPFHKKITSKKVKKFAVKHGKKIGGAALTAVKQTASTFGPLKKVKIAYKAGKAIVTGVNIAKPAVTKTVKKAKHYISQYSTTDKTWGHDVIKNIMFKSKKNIKQIAKKLDTQTSGYLQTFRTTAKGYKESLKARAKGDILNRTPAQIASPKGFSQGTLGEKLVSIKESGWKTRLNIGKSVVAKLKNIWSNPK